MTEDERMQLDKERFASVGIKLSVKERLENYKRVLSVEHGRDMTFTDAIVELLDSRESSGVKVA